MTQMTAVVGNYSAYSTNSLCTAWKFCYETSTHNQGRRYFEADNWEG